ncbi:MAG: cytochrome c4 [Gammaproteobacteria bacterium]|nr:cytochrome c4 [Gammaproteobacteria bacterium]
MARYNRRSIPFGSEYPMACRSFLLCLLALLCQTFVVAAQDGKDKAAPCPACHGADGNSIAPIWPNLAGQHVQYLTAQLAAFKSGARQDPSMTPMAMPLSDADMQEISAYYSSSQPAINSMDVSQAAAGAAIYRGGNPASGVPACMACHGPDGSGNGLAYYPALRGQNAEYVVKQLRDYRDRNRTTDGNETMQTIAQRMTVEEMESVARYMSALH